MRGPFPALRLPLYLLLLLLLLLPLALAPADAGNAPPSAVAASPPPSFRMQEMQKLRVQQEQDLAALAQEWSEAGDFASRWDVERRMQARKIETEKAFLRLQIRWARQDGRPRTLEHLRASLAAYENLARRAAPATPVEVGP